MSSLARKLADLIDSSGDVKSDRLDNTISLGDNVKATFGASNDLQVYHDGNNSYVRDTGTGNLILRGSSNVFIQGENGETLIQGSEDGQAKLFHNNNNKLATTSTGVDVTGTVTADQFNNDEVRHSIRPSLLLDFANSKTLDPRITFSRSSTATYYDGKTHTKAEENLLKYSQQFDNLGGWATARGAITANATSAPDGTTTADKLYHNSGTGNMVAYQNLQNYSNAYDYAVSCYFKAGEIDYGLIRTGGGSRKTWFNLATGAVGTSHADHTASITDVGNGWYRCSVIETNMSATQIDFGGAETDGGNEPSTVNDGIYLWGAQVEQRSSVTAYTPTTSQPITNYIPTLQTASAGSARFDHDPVTGESKGLLIEEQRTNVMDYSIPYYGWGASHPRYENYGIAPDGTQTAVYAHQTNGTSAQQLTQRTDGVYTVGNYYTISVYAKALTGDYIAIHKSGEGQVKFDLTDGSASDNSFSDSTAGTDDVGNGWYRCYVTFEAQSVVSTCYIAVAPTIGVFTGAGEGYSVLLWGAQVEEGSFPTSYIPTSGSQVTRGADDAYIDGEDFTNFYNYHAGTLYTHITPISIEKSSGTYNAIRVRNDNYAEDFIVRYSSVISGADVYAKHNGSVVSDTASTTVTAGTDFKSAVAYKDDMQFTADGSAVQNDTSWLVPIPTELHLADASNHHLKKFAYYPARLTNAELQALTED